MKNKMTGNLSQSKIPWEENSIRDVMVSLSEIVSVELTDTLLKAMDFLTEKENHFNLMNAESNLVMVRDKNEKVVGFIRPQDILKTFDPVCGEIGGPPTIRRTGFSPRFLQSMLHGHSAFPKQPAESFLGKHLSLPVATLMHKLSPNEQVDEHTRIWETIHRMIWGRHEVFLVTAKKKPLGIISLNGLAGKIFRHQFIPESVTIYNRKIKMNRDDPNFSAMV